MALLLFLRCPGYETTPVELDLNATVGDLKQEVQLVQGIEASKQRLTYGTVELNDLYAMLADTGVGMQSTIDVHVGFCLLVAADIWGIKRNCRLQFAERPRPRALLEAIEQHFTPLYEGERPKGYPVHPFRVENLKVFDEELQRWVDLRSTTQLECGRQLYAFQPTLYLHSEAQGRIPDPDEVCIPPQVLEKLRKEDETASEEEEAERDEDLERDEEEGGPPPSFPVDVATDLYGRKHNMRIKIPSGLALPKVVSIVESVCQERAKACKPGGLSDAIAQNFKVESMQVYDDNRRYWVDVQSAPQLTPGCQLFCHAPLTPLQTEVPGAIPRPPSTEAIACGSGEDPDQGRFRVLCATDLFGFKWNHEMAFSSPPSLEELRVAVVCLYDPLLRAVRPSEADDAPFTVDFLTVFDDRRQSWRDLESADQLVDCCQLMCFQPPCAAHDESRGVIPEPRTTFTWTCSEMSPLLRTDGRDKGRVPEWSERLRAVFEVTEGSAEGLTKALKEADMQLTTVRVPELIEKIRMEEVEDEGEGHAEKTGEISLAQWERFFTSCPNLVEGIYFRLCVDLLGFAPSGDKGVSAEAEEEGT